MGTQSNSLELKNMTSKFFTMIFILACSINVNASSYDNFKAVASQLPSRCVDNVIMTKPLSILDFAASGMYGVFCAITIPIVMPAYYASISAEYVGNSVQALFQTDFEKADQLANKALSGAHLTSEENEMLVNFLKELADKNIITVDSAVVSADGLSVEQLKLIVVSIHGMTPKN